MKRLRKKRGINIIKLELNKIQNRKDELIKPIESNRTKISVLEDKIREDKKINVLPNHNLRNEWENLYKKGFKLKQEFVPEIQELQIKERELKLKLEELEEKTLQKQYEKQQRKIEQKKKESQERYKKLITQPINIRRYLTRRQIKGHRNWLTWKVLYLSEKKDKRMLDQICKMYNLELTNNLTRYEKIKYKKCRLSEYNRSIYLIPIDRNTRKMR